MSLSLRIYRTFKWVPEIRPLELLSIGGNTHKVLESTDTLQFKNADATDWSDVKIVEAEQPPYPVALSSITMFTSPIIGSTTIWPALTAEQTRHTFDPYPPPVVSALTSDPTNPALNVPRNPEGSGQNNVYLVLSDAELSKGFVRPYRSSYRHLVCGSVTTMGIKVAETYAADPKFYGSTFCDKCGNHFPVQFFSWTEDNQIVGS